VAWSLRAGGEVHGGCTQVADQQARERAIEFHSHWPLFDVHMEISREEDERGAWRFHGHLTERRTLHWRHAGQPQPQAARRGIALAENIGV